MALDGINYLVAVSQMKATNANEAAAETQASKPKQRTTSFSNWFQAIAEASSTSGSYKLAEKEKRSDDSTTEKASLGALAIRSNSPSLSIFAT
jgi:hypothetical protein